MHDECFFTSKIYSIIQNINLLKSQIELEQPMKNKSLCKAWAIFASKICSFVLRSRLINKLKIYLKNIFYYSKYKPSKSQTELEQPKKKKSLCKA